ncbi:MAG: 6-carboxytetrahydropterin synthase [Proteobacteria bacterium]|nr:6-carboxytetrahydropterin synthase [Pseudomonadota bacterium]
MISCTRKIEFDAGHRIMRHESKCKMLHGHRYVLEITFVSQGLDKLGRVIDFGIVKDVLGKWIDDNLDHNLILCIEDKKLGDQVAAITGQTIYYMKDNPTAENIAEHLRREICPRLFADYEVKCLEIKISETPNCYAKSTD